MNRTRCPFALLIPLAFACFALSPSARATCQGDCLPDYNTALGRDALISLTNGRSNTAVGSGALSSNSTGYLNTATGFQALFENQIGVYNTASGAAALKRNTVGNENTATGFGALFRDTSGSENTATGAFALQGNTTGGANTATGESALEFNRHGSFNTATGERALWSNTTGAGNTAIGWLALVSNITGSDNTAIGKGAGGNVFTASNVTCIGSNVAGADVGNTTWVGNVFGVPPQSGTTAPVIVSDSGQLGTVVSSERFKKDIVTMDKASEAILSFRPVAFHYKTDTKETPQFGLIAEEVAKVNPALVVPDKEGKPYTVRYDAVNAMLLNEFLKEHRKVEQMQKQIDILTAGLQKVSAQLELGKSVSRTVSNNQ